MTNYNIPLEFDPSIPDYNFESMYQHHFLMDLLERTYDETFNLSGLQFTLITKQMLLAELFIDKRTALRNSYRTLKNPLRNTLLRANQFIL